VNCGKVGYYMITETVDRRTGMLQKSDEMEF
jgi:hypothetical protein